MFQHVLFQLNKGQTYSDDKMFGQRSCSVWIFFTFPFLSMFGCKWKGVFVEALAGLIYIWVILSCVSSSSGVLWCTAVHWCDQSLWVWSAVIITALHSLKSTFVCLVSIENVLLLVEVLTHYMSEVLVIFHGGKIFHSSCTGNLSNEAYFKTTNYFSIVTLFIYLFFAFIHFCFCFLNCKVFINAVL